MLQNNLYSRVREISPAFSMSLVPRRDPETGVLLCTPAYFDVETAINPHMVDALGRLKTVDSVLAQSQWDVLVGLLGELGLKVEVLQGEPGLPDMVFAANQSFPFRRDDGELCVLLSSMRAPERRGEVDFYRAWYVDHGFEVVDFAIPTSGSFEGMGDLIWQPSRKLLFAGVGPRTSQEVVEKLPQVLALPVISLELVDPAFYHLDTALVPLDDERVLIHPPAFSAASLELLERIFPEFLIPPAEEAQEGFACNALGLPGRRVVLDQSCPKTAKLLENAGFQTHMIDTSEFRKSGGSVFCMKMMLPEG